MADLEDVYLQLEQLRNTIETRLPEQGEQGEPGKRRPLRKDDVLAALLARATQTGSEHSSVRLARNAKGDTQIEIVVRSGDSPDIETAAQALAEATRLYDNCRELYPLIVGPARD